MKKTITLLILLVLLLSACGKKAEVNDSSVANIKDLPKVEEEISEPVYTPETIKSEIDRLIGSRTKSAEAEVLVFAKEKIGEDLYLEQRIEYKETDEGFNGIIKLDFTGETNTKHIVSIPKEFAQSVNDLTFSLEPSRIINPDPVVEFSLKLEGFSVVGIEITTEGKGTAVELFDAFDKQKSFDLCKKVPEGMRDLCYAAAVGKLKKPKITDCDNIKSDEGKDSCYGAVAAANDDINICAKYIKSEETKTTCYAAFAAVKGKEICAQVKDEAAKKVCILFFEAKEKGKTFEELAKEKLEEPIKPEEDIVFDLRILAGDDDEYFINRSYSFEASLDPPSATPKNPEYEFKFSDNVTKKETSNTISREFKKASTYTLTAKIINKSTGEIAGTKSRSFTFKPSSAEASEGKEEEVKEVREMKDTGLSKEDCAGKAEECAETCGETCEEKKGEYCRKHEYSGCALDVFCWCNSCAIYDAKWCPDYAGFIGCAEGVKGKYKGCIENCQSKRESGGDVSTCWADCNKEFDSGIVECKQDPCEEFCASKGYDKGEWAKYTGEYGWDSCYCTD